MAQQIAHIRSAVGPGGAVVRSGGAVPRPGATVVSVALARLVAHLQQQLFGAHLVHRIVGNRRAGLIV